MILIMTMKININKFSILITIPIILIFVITLNFKDYLNIPITEISINHCQYMILNDY